MIWLQFMAMSTCCALAAYCWHRKRTISALAALALAVVLALGAALTGVEGGFTDYANRCREHGGTPVKIESSMLCQGSDGRFVDVRW